MAKKNLNGRLCKLVDELVSQGLTLEQARREFEKQFILSAMRAHSGSVSKSAAAIGVHRNTLRNKVGNLGIASATPKAGQKKQTRKRARS